MIPPEIINIIKDGYGFIIVTTVNGRVGPSLYVFRGYPLEERRKIMEQSKFQTLWKHKAALGARIPRGYLMAYTENSFFQKNNDATLAFYAVKNYSQLVAAWFDNKTQERIA